MIVYVTHLVLTTVQTSLQCCMNILHTEGEREKTNSHEVENKVIKKSGAYIKPIFVAIVVVVHHIIKLQIPSKNKLIKC